ncbi:hypothetical protein Tco_0823324 [Tanacetum coccineum]|uniref:Uncharacterized protein n=1 Tax=Tanacetum coccineum TaxID=301880 RepID=A0ABQ5AHL3_9ASTR
MNTENVSEYPWICIVSELRKFGYKRSGGKWHYEEGNYERYDFKGWAQSFPGFTHIMMKRKMRCKKRKMKSRTRKDQDQVRQKWDQLARLQLCKTLTIEVDLRDSSRASNSKTTGDPSVMVMKILVESNFRRGGLSLYWYVLGDFSKRLTCGRVCQVTKMESSREVNSDIILCMVENSMEI